MKVRSISVFVAICAVLITAMSNGVSAEKVTLRLQVEGGESQIPVWQLVVDAFEREYPHIEVSLEVAGSVDDLIVQAIAEVAPDVIGLQEIQIMQLLDSGLLLKLDPYVESEPEILEDLHPIAVVVARNREGVLYGLPTAFSSLLWYYDQQLFDEAGLGQPDGNWSWTPSGGGDFVETARKLTRSTGDGRVGQWGMVLPSSWSRYLPFIVQNGGYYWSEDQTTATIDRDEFVDAIDFIASLVHQHGVAPRPGVSAGAFGSGSVAMYYSGRWEVPNLRKNAVNPWDVVVPPKGPAGRAATVGAGYTAITTSTNHPDEAWLLLKFLASETSYRLRDTEGQTVPPIRSLATSGFFLDSTPPNNNIAFFEVVDYGATIPLHSKWPEINNVVHPQISSVFRGEASARIAMEEVVDQVHAILRNDEPSK